MSSLVRRGDDIYNIYVKVTDKCNCVCEHCFILNRSNKSFLDKDLINLINGISDILNIHKQKKVNLIFHGGEPLLMGQKFYEKVIEEVNSNKNLWYGIQTNLLLYNKTWEPIFTVLFKNRIGTSYDLTRYVKGSHDEFKKIWFKKFEEASQSNFIEVRFVVTKLFYDLGVNYWISFIKDLQIKSFAFEFYIDPGKSSILYLDYEDYMKFLYEFSIKWFDFYGTLDFYPVRNYIESKQAIGFNCIGRNTVVNPDGSVSCCPALYRETKIGKWGNEFLQLFSLNKHVLAYKSRFLKLPYICQSCEYLQFCNTPSFCVKKYFLSGFRGIYCKKLIKFLLENDLFDVTTLNGERRYQC